jgi:uncharacterized protein (TIGR00255 family)
LILSMTAFGRAQKQAFGYSVTIEIRALNGRLLDIVLRLPKNYLEFEDAFRKLIAKRIRRGRVEVFVQIEHTAAEQLAPRLNPSLAHLYWGQLQEIHLQLPGSDPPTLDHLLHIPHLFTPTEPDTDREALADLLTDTLGEVIEQVQLMRIQEGRALIEDFLARTGSLRQGLSVIEGRKELVLEEYQKRLRDRIQELLGETALDENRLLQEVAYFAERSDINEELVRLKSHLDQIETILSDSKPTDGRKLDFLMQELHREVNTIGSKTNDLETIQIIVDMKAEIGKLKEQVQNVE